VFQIVTSFPFSLNIALPASTTKFFQAMTFVNLSPLSVGSPQCYMRFDYVDKLVLVTSAPLVVVAATLFLLLCHSVYYKVVAKKDYRDLIPRYLRLIVVVTYLVLPSVTTTIFGAFTTVNIDPEGLVPGMPRYLRNDYAIAENTARYSFGFAWAVVMIFVYVFVSSILFLLRLVLFCSCPSSSFSLSW